MHCGPYAREMKLMQVRREEGYIRWENKARSHQCIGGCKLEYYKLDIIKIDTIQYVIVL